MLAGTPSHLRRAGSVPSLSSETIDPWGNIPEFGEPSSNQSTNPPLSASNSIRRRQRLNHIDTGVRQGDGQRSGHPLDSGGAPSSRSGLGFGWGLNSEVSDDVSRPTLKRLTSETERQAAESSRGGSEGGSLRGSFDLLRMSAADASSAGEVEVLIHHVKTGESLPGIALLYGIDLATLRKTNKLWPSDPVHLRTHLYVPLEACRWNKASESIIRGPGEGQITLVSKHQVVTRKGKGKEVDPTERGGLSGYLKTSPTRSARTTSNLVDLESPSRLLTSRDEEDRWDEELARTFMPSTNQLYEGITAARGLPQAADLGDALGRRTSLDYDDSSPRILDVVRIPSSQLRFFPRPQSNRPDISSRNSLDEPDTPQTHGRRSSVITEGGAIQNNLNHLPPHLQPSKPPIPSAPPPKSKMVKLRPPQATIPAPSKPNTIGSRLASLFDVPPPPLQSPFGALPHPPPKSRPRASMESTSSPRMSRRSSVASSGRQPDVLLELRPRASKETIRPNGNREISKKHD